MNSTRGVPGWPAESHEGAVRTFYRRDGVVVSTTWLIVSEHRYAVAELHRLRTVRGSRSPLVTGTAAVAVAYAVAVAISLPYLTPVAWVGVAAIGAIPGGLALAAWRMNPRPFQLWADYHGRTMPIYTSADQRTFGHVCRALIRAREQQPPEPPYADAVA